MRRLMFLLTMLFPAAAAAGEPATKMALPECVRCLVCPDDYHRKPWPCLPHAICGGLCDHYCKKPLPHLPCPVPGVHCDDYYKKPWSCPPRPHWSPWLACPPA